MTAPTEQTVFEQIRAQLKSIGVALSDVGYSGSYADGINTLKGHIRFLTKQILQEQETNRKLSEQLASAHQEASDRTNTACEALAELERVRELSTAALRWCYNGTMKQLVKPSHSFEEWLDAIYVELMIAAPQQEQKE